MESAIDVWKDLYVCFIDYPKAFDKVKHSDLFDILLRHNCDGKDLRVIRNLYWEQLATIRIGDDWGVYNCRGVRQGCVFSPDLFNIYSIKHHEGVRVRGNNINNLWYSNDTVLIVDLEEKLQDILRTVTVKSKNKGLQLNAKKTEFMVINIWYALLHRYECWTLTKDL